MFRLHSWHAMLNEHLIKVESTSNLNSTLIQRCVPARMFKTSNIHRLIIYNGFTSRSRNCHLHMYMETSPMPVKGCKILAYARRSGPFTSREGSLACHTCCDTGPRFFRSHPKDHPILSPLTTHKRMWKIYSIPDPHGFQT
jgi:hypothetical protein